MARIVKHLTKNLGDKLSPSWCLELAKPSITRKLAKTKGTIEMKVYELIEKLKDLPQHLDVLIWDAGNRCGIADVDESFINETDYPFVEINTDTDN